MTTIDEAREANRLAIHRRGVRWGVGLCAFFYSRRGLTKKPWLTLTEIGMKAGKDAKWIDGPWGAFSDTASLREALDALTAEGFLLCSYYEWEKSGKPPTAFGGPDSTDERGLPAQLCWRLNANITALFETTNKLRGKSKPGLSKAMRQQGNNNTETN